MREQARYDMDGRRWREYRRAMRMRHPEPRFRDWAIPVFSGIILLYIIADLSYRAVGM